MLVWQNEVIEYIERTMRGFTVDDDTLALDLIDKVGPGGDFIAERHTVEHFRQEIWVPNLLDRDFWSVWEDAGRPDTASRVRTRLDELLASYEPTPLDDDIDACVDSILDDARKHLA